MVSLPALRCVCGSALSLFLPLRSGVPQAPPVLTSSVPAPLALLAPGVGDCHPRAARVSPACAPRPCTGWLAPASLHRWLHPFPVSFTLHAFMGGVLRGFHPVRLLPSPAVRSLRSLKPSQYRSLRSAQAPALAVQSLVKNGRKGIKWCKKQLKSGKKSEKNWKKAGKKLEKGQKITHPKIFLEKVLKISQNTIS